MFQTYRFVDPDFDTATVPAVDVTASSYSRAKREAARAGVRNVRRPTRVTAAIRMVSRDSLSYQASLVRCGDDDASAYATEFCVLAWQ